MLIISLQSLYQHMMKQSIFPAVKYHIFCLFLCGARNKGTVLYHTGQISFPKEQGALPKGENLCSVIAVRGLEESEGRQNFMMQQCSCMAVSSHLIYLFNRRVNLVSCMKSGWYSKVFSLSYKRLFRFHYSTVRI